MSSTGDGRLPVFVVPSTLFFYADDQKTHKQILTLYNPHDFPIKFKVLCTTPQKYIVVCPKGTIKPRHCIDIVVRHNAVSAGNCGVTDRFRIQMQEHGSHSVAGKKDVEARLLPGKPQATSVRGSSENFEQLPELEQSSMMQREYRMPPSQTSSRNKGGPSVLVVLLAAICLAVLMFPDVGENNPHFPVYLHLSTNKKVVAAFVLGLVTMSILQT